MNLKFDLLGHPIPENHGKAGANGHIATPENVNKVRTLLIAGMGKAEIAAQLGISIPTLNKHYFKAGAKEINSARALALSDAMAKNLLRLDAAAEKGNVSAIKELNAIYQAAVIKALAADLRGDDEDEAANKKTKAPATVGKKQQKSAAAEAARQNNDLLDPTKFH